jgi:hypothetical protein
MPVHWRVVYMPLAISADSNAKSIITSFWRLRCGFGRAIVGWRRLAHHTVVLAREIHTLFDLSTIGDDE